MDNWKEAIKLEYFIKNYIPKGFREAIRVFDFVPAVTEADYIVIYGAWKNGFLDFAMSNYNNEIVGIKVYRFNKPFIIEAINEYFKINN